MRKTFYILLLVFLFIPGCAKPAGGYNNTALPQITQQACENIPEVEVNMITKLDTKKEYDEFSSLCSYKDKNNDYYKVSFGIFPYNQNNTQNKMSYFESLEFKEFSGLGEKAFYRFSNEQKNTLLPAGSYIEFHVLAQGHHINMIMVLKQGSETELIEKAKLMVKRIISEI